MHFFDRGQSAGNSPKACRFRMRCSPLTKRGLRSTFRTKKTVEEKQLVVIRQNFIDPQNLEIVREGMREGVNGAGAPLASSLILNSLPVPVAAKTGTAQLRKDANGKDLMNSWANVFAPYDDPQIVLVVMMGDVHEGQFAVLPVAKDVLNWYFGPKNVDGVRISDIAATATSTDSTPTTVPADVPTATTTAPQQ